MAPCFVICLAYVCHVQVDNSCKWAGGGVVSTVGDLVKFGNAMLYSYQFRGGRQQKAEDKKKGGGEKGSKCKYDIT